MPTESPVYYNKHYLEEEARQLARSQAVSRAKKPIRAVAPMLENAKEVLTLAYRDLARLAKQKKELSSAGDWLLDNFYIIQEQIVQLKEDLPPSYYKKLPRLSEGEYRGLPRTYELVEKLAYISDNIIDRENATTAVQAYQETVTLELGELWAIPILIRLSLLNRLVEKSEQLLEKRRVRDRVERLLEEILESSSEEPGLLIRKLTEVSVSPDDNETYLTVLAQQLQAAGLLTDTERRWFDYKFRRLNSTLEDQLRIEAQRTSRLHLSIQNAISTLREVSETDWSDFVENCSVVDRILRLDPSAYYGKMDFQSRDRYRKVIEKLSSHSSYSESEVAQKALLLAEEASQYSRNGQNRDDLRECHIGYYLQGEGYLRLAKELGYRMPLDERIQRWAGHNFWVYPLFISVHTVVLLAIVGIFSGLFDAPVWAVVLALASSFLPALDLAIVSTNRLLSLWLPPRTLSKLELERGIPDEYRTVVVVPTLFASPEDVRQQFEALEIRSIANPRRGLQFMILSDFTDAAQQELPGDEAIIQEARKQAEELNRRYSSRYGDRFLFLHRKRLWNPSEGVWMGWERKRGKLEEFNRLLCRPESETTFLFRDEDFMESVGRVPVQYVITLDADTQLPPGSALDMIRTAAHPLNRPEISEGGETVNRGYGIIQPRISIPPKAAAKTWFAHIFSGNVGLDPYTTAVSDVYQDLYGEGIFTGKGIYNLEIFHKLLDGRFPENTVLSHDLLESTYLRCGLATDIELFDDYPTTYLNFSKRNHRWIRGDWQILRWLLLKVPGMEGGMYPNPVHSLSRWKIFDNLRRSLTPLFLLVMLLLGWTVLPGPAAIWTLAVLGIMAFPIYSSFTTEIFARPPRVKWKLYLEKIRSNMKINTIQAVATFLFMPHQAYVTLDAVGRTLWRMFVSRKHLLEWTSASQVERSSADKFLLYWKKMWINPTWAVICFAISWWVNPAVVLLVAPFALSWSVAPGASWVLGSRGKRITREELSSGDKRRLRLYARQTWSYFERYVDEEHSWLPPDNFQEDPYLGSVGRTSPTNMGLALASTAAAFDFGYITAGELIGRMDKVIGSMKRLDRYSGHFYNWYSTKLGEVINPRYISTVDSGNLAASLLFVKQALMELVKSRWPHPSFWNGLSDTLGVVWDINEELKNTNIFEKNYEKTAMLLEQANELMAGEKPKTLRQWEESLLALVAVLKELASADFAPFMEQLPDADLEVLQDWFRRPLMQAENQLDEVRSYLDAAGDEEALTESELHLRDLFSCAPFSGWQKTIQSLADDCNRMVDEMDFSILYNKNRDLFSIGYNIDRATLDKSTYDLLASEARLASFIAIAKGEVPPKHWFKLSRRLTSIERNEILLSWGGTMFEYLMPLLFLSRFEDTLLSQTYDNVVSWQHNYGDSRDKPWGFSESGYAVMNIELNYQYRAFGAPGLGLKRGLAEDYVVSPYSSMLALMVKPRAAMDNLARLEEEGAIGLNGFYEAVDYTPERGDEEDEKSIVRMYMAHHQGMSLLALANVLKGNMVQRIFHKDPLIRSCELLLQEQIPRGIPIKEPRPIEVELEPGEEQKTSTAVDHSSKDALNESPPRTHILSNGRLSTVITHAGTGYSFCGERALTRWRAERVKDARGFFFYVKDLESNVYWSAGHRPVNREADRYDSWFHPGKVQTARVDEWIETFTEVCVSPEDNIELRKITLTNYSDRQRRIELTSYAEAVLNRLQADAAHPAFSNLFVQTEFVPEHHALMAMRRPRSAHEEPVWLVHTLASDDLNSLPEPLQYETDREKFIGRARSLDSPVAMDPGNRLSGSVGNVPDPVVSMRRVINLGPGEKRSVTFGLGMAHSREEALAMADHYDNYYATERIFELASIYGRVELDHIGISGEQAHYFQKLAGAMLYGSELLRAPEETLLRNRRSQSGLWAYGISGDLPVCLYRISETDHIRYVDRLLKAHTFWRLKGLEADLVIINDHPPSYVDELNLEIGRRIQASLERHLVGKRGGVFVIRGDDMPPEDSILLETVASVSLKGKLPRLDFRSIDKAGEKEREPKAEKEKKRYRLLSLSDVMGSAGRGSSNSDLLFHNGYGGFSGDGKEYVIRLEAGGDGKGLVYPPAPWINVIANPEFGFITSERGSDYNWSLNSRENRLTPWSNDAVIDPAGEAVYIRDEEHRLFWSPTPGPSPGSNRYEIRHGFGYSRYISQTMNIRQELTKWVAVDDPVKIIRLQLTNTDLMSRSFSVYHYLEWVLGVFREESSRFVVTTFDPELQAIFAVNRYNNEFADRVAFAAPFTDAERLEDSFTSDRTWFIGKNRGVTDPRAVALEESLSGRFGSGFDPCAVSQLKISLASGESKDIYFMLGESGTSESARNLVKKYRDSSVLESSLREVKSFWSEKLSRIELTSPAPELDILFNGWLQYQNIACRMWGRTGFYQSGGAFGFRDQLQDASAALYIDPELTKKQILRHAARQFEEGDVQHWWHPPSGRGIRSRITDDLLWLPYVTAFYVKATGDAAILDEPVPFITARKLEEGEQEAYLVPEASGESATLYEHCCLTIDRSLTSGPHGLPLIGAGDWNDGMNSVGEEGRGESVWLGFFLYDVLSAFIPICRSNKDAERLKRYTAYRKKLKTGLNREGWDGEWYRRAFYDDGTPIGSSANEECKIDVIAQAWAVISGVAPPAKARKALESAERYLIDRDEGIIRLLTPPFDKTEKNPGYIKGYIPGVRENGGQYTHGALWLIKAYAEKGMGDLAVQLLRMISPVNHSFSKERADRYKGEPYAVAADIYGELPLAGMAGWTWYTGSAGWMYRVLLESILGFSLENGKVVTIRPSIPAGWKGYAIRLREADNGTVYDIKVNNEAANKDIRMSAEVDGKPLDCPEHSASFELLSDGSRHKVEIILTSEKELQD